MPSATTAGTSSQYRGAHQRCSATARLPTWRLTSRTSRRPRRLQRHPRRHPHRLHGGVQKAQADRGVDRAGPDADEPGDAAQPRGAVVQTRRWSTSHCCRAPRPTASTCTHCALPPGSGTPGTTMPTSAGCKRTPDEQKAAERGFRYSKVRTQLIVRPNCGVVMNLPPVIGGQAGLAEPAAGGREQICLLHDRTRCRLLGCDDHRAAYRASRRRVRAQRHEVVQRRALSDRWQVLVVMGTTDLNASAHLQRSIVIVPRSTLRVAIGRSPQVFGFEGRGGHPEVIYATCTCPSAACSVSRGWLCHLPGVPRAGPDPPLHAGDWCCRMSSRADGQWSIASPSAVVRPP